MQINLIKCFNQKYLCSIVEDLYNCSAWWDKWREIFLNIQCLLHLYFSSFYLVDLLNSYFVLFSLIISLFTKHSWFLIFIFVLHFYFSLPSQFSYASSFHLFQLVFFRVATNGTWRQLNALDIFLFLTFLFRIPHMKVCCKYHWATEYWRQIYLFTNMPDNPPFDIWIFSTIETLCSSNC